MKKLFTLSILMLIAFTYQVNGQSTRLVLAEEFTQASCPPCASQNPAFNTLLDANPTKVVAIKYQTNWPGVDPMNVNTQQYVGTRVTYYSVTGVPHANMDGTAQTGSSYTGAPANWTQAKLNARAAIASPFTMGVSHYLSSDADSIYISVDISASLAVSGNLVAHVAVIEREIDFCSAPGSNGEKDFLGVMQMMLPNASGTTLANTWTVSQSQQLTFAVALPGYIYDKNRLAVVAFIQDNTSKEVHQAAYSAPQPLASDARVTCDAFAGLPVVSCGGSLTPVLNVENSGSSTLTALTVNYNLDGIPATPVNWTGSLASGATAAIALPTITSPTAGTHNIDATIVNPNGSPDLNITYDAGSANFTVTSAVGAALPVIQAFASSTFPPTNWFKVNSDNGYTWTRNSTAGYNGAGCAKIDFYNSPDGEIDELWVPNQDFSVSGTTTAQLDFDVAYTPYSASYNDRIEVLYSIDCGANWVSVFNEAGTTLAHGNPVSTSAWTPTSAASWHHITASLNGAVGNNSVFVKFKATSAYGNNGYIDNININTNLTTSIPQLFNDADVNVYPNPSTGNVNVQMNLSKSQDVTIVVTNALGAIVKTLSLTDVTSGIFAIDLSTEAKGSYEVSIRTNDQVVTKRVSITE